MSNPAVLEFKSVSKSYGLRENQQQILNNCCFKAEMGQSHGLLGASGCGKSTFLNLAGLLDVPSSGTVSLKGLSTETLTRKEKATLRAQKIGFVFQFHHLLPDLTVLENLTLPHKIAGCYHVTQSRERALELLSSLGLEAKESQLPLYLSGGERQRIAIARALMNKPDLLLADEPTGNLDDESSRKVLDLLVALCREEKTALIMVTHDQKLASLLDTVYHIKNGQLVEV